MNTKNGKEDSGRITAAWITGTLGIIAACIVVLGSTIPSWFSNTSKFPTVSTQVQIYSPTPSLPPPSLPEGYISIGNYFSGKVNSNGKSGNQVYSHFISGKIKYIRISADDDLDKIEMACTDFIINISEKFYPILKPEGEIFPNYASEALEIPANCRIDFYVVDTIGIATGITVYAEAVP